MNKELADRLLKTTAGMQTGAIIAAMLDRHDEVKGPKYVGKAIVTSDGFVICNFETAEGIFHHGAFVGGLQELSDNVDRLADFLELSAIERNELTSLVANWIATDYRS